MEKPPLQGEDEVFLRLDILVQCSAIPESGKTNGEKSMSMILKCGTHVTKNRTWMGVPSLVPRPHPLTEARAGGARD